MEFNNDDVEKRRMITQQSIDKNVKPIEIHIERKKMIDQDRLEFGRKQEIMVLKTLKIYSPRLIIQDINELQRHFGDIQGISNLYEFLFEVKTMNDLGTVNISINCLNSITEYNDYWLFVFVNNHSLLFAKALTVKKYMMKLPTVVLPSGDDGKCLQIYKLDSTLTLHQFAQIYQLV